jgi:diguanylate cyclase (GGDEF)-like protein/PAS domain S-box-containing protein
MFTPASPQAALLDHLVRLAARSCGVAVAILQLAGEGGVPPEAPLSFTEGWAEVPVESAFLAHLSRADAWLQVPDASADPRFAADPLVTGRPRLRLLAGVPVFLPSGARAGLLCVADPGARTLDAREQELLLGFAVAVSQVLALGAGQGSDGRQPDDADRPAESVAALPVEASSEPPPRPVAASDESPCRQCAAALPYPQPGGWTHQEQVRLAVQRQTDILRLVTEAIPATVVVVGGDNCYHFVNSAFERYAGRPRDQILGRTAMDVLGEVEVARRRPWMKRALSGETVCFTLDYPSPEGTLYLEFTCIPLKMAGGEVDGFVGISQDITAQRREQDRLTDLARQDALTGVLNRLGFEQQIEHHVRQGRGGQLGLLYIDLDGFKPVNDRHGHAAGDQVLEQFAQRLKTLVRPTDAVARLGGDEFAVLLVGLREPANAAVVAAKVVHAAACPFDTDIGPLAIGASVGAAFGVNVELGWRELIARADALLYAAKAAGRGTHRGPF